MSEIIDLEKIITGKIFVPEDNSDNVEHLRNIAELCGNIRKIANGRRKIAEYFGEAKQVLKLSEEMGELNQVLMKYLIYGNKEYPEFRKKVIEEMADVLNVLRQLTYIWNIEDADMVSMMAFKVERTLQRIEDGKLNKASSRN